MTETERRIMNRRKAVETFAQMRSDADYSAMSDNAIIYKIAASLEVTPQAVWKWIKAARTEGKLN